MLQAIAAWDAEVLLWIQANIRTPIGNVLIPLWSALGNGGMLWIALALVLLLFRKTRRAGVLALGGMALNLLVVNGIIKNAVGRPRPWLVVEGLDVLLYSSDPNSFPSGHTSAAFAFASAVSCVTERVWVRVVVLGAALCMGLSRLYVGVHFPSDVLCGAPIGALCGLAAVWVYRRWLQEKFPLT